MLLLFVAIVGLGAGGTRRLIYLLLTLLVLLHVARGHLIPVDISAGAGLGVPSVEDDADVGERQVVHDAVDLLAAAGVLDPPCPAPEPEDR